MRRRGFVRAVALNALAAAPGFNTAVQPVPGQNCVACHNGKLTSGNLNINGFLDPASIAVAGFGRGVWAVEVHRGDRRQASPVDGGCGASGRRSSRRLWTLPVPSLCPDSSSVVRPRMRMLMADARIDWQFEAQTETDRDESRPCRHECPRHGSPQ